MTSIELDGCVTFRFYRPRVSQVKVLGTFNGWSGESLIMDEMGDGWWTVTAELPAGEYRFRYLADGEWFSDYASHGVENGKFGWNSVLVVSQMKSARSIGMAGSEAAETDAIETAMDSEFQQMRTAA